MYLRRVVVSNGYTPGFERLSWKSRCARHSNSQAVPGLLRHSVAVHRDTSSVRLIYP